jgi:alanine racemase
MWQAEVLVDLDAIRANVARLRALSSTAELMTVVKADAYGHGLLPTAGAALQAGADWLGVCTLDEALTWLLAPGLPLADGVAADIDLAAASRGQLGELIEAARRVGRPARVHLKVDTGLTRGGATAKDWPDLAEAAAKAQADGVVEVVGVWSHLACADVPGHPSVDRQLAAFHDGLAVAHRFGLRPCYRHLANSAATLTRPDTHFDLVRVGVATYGLSPVRGADFGLRPAMSVRGRVMLTKRVPAGTAVSYGHTYTTDRETTLAVVPLGYADGVPRSASSTAQVRLAGRNRTIAGRVCMDQFVLDCADDPVAAGDEVILFGDGRGGEPTADDWAEVLGTINYEIVTRFGAGARLRRRYSGGLT